MVVSLKPERLKRYKDVAMLLIKYGRSDLISHALLALNLGQLPASLLLVVVAGRLERRAWPYVVSGVVSLASLAGIVVSDGAATIAWSALLGFSAASALILGLSLPPLLCRPTDVARTSAGMFTLSYGGAVLIAIISGALWDVSGLPALSFAPLAVCAVALAGVALRMRQRHELV